MDLKTKVDEYMKKQPITSNDAYIKCIGYIYFKTEDIILMHITKNGSRYDLKILVSNFVEIFKAFFDSLILDIVNGVYICTYETRHLKIILNMELSSYERFIKLMKKMNGKLTDKFMYRISFGITKICICGTDKKLMKCARCEKVYYCSMKCHKLDWENHKLSCSMEQPMIINDHVVVIGMIYDLFQKKLENKN
jgi:hypothetical protein